MLTRKIEADSLLFYEGDKLVLTMTETEVGKDMLITLDGELCSEMTHHFQDELEAFISTGMKVIVDFGAVSFVAPSVLNALLDVQQLADFFRKGGLILRNLSGEVYEKMDRCGLTDLLMIEE